MTGVITPPPLGMWMTSHGQCPRGGACEQEWGCFSIFLMTSRGQCPRGVVLVKNPVSAPGSPPFKNPGSVPASVHKTKVKIWYAYKVYFSVHM